MMHTVSIDVSANPAHAKDIHIQPVGTNSQHNTGRRSSRGHGTTKDATIEQMSPINAEHDDD